MINQAQLFLLKTRFITSEFSSELYRMKFKGDQSRYNLFVHNGTQLCIEGFPRSANSFAFNVVRIANPEMSHIARHIHTLGQIAISTKKKIPTLLVIRDPQSTISSLIKGYSPGDASCLLRAYIVYYKGILRWCNDVIVSDFDKTTLHLDFVLEKLNARYGMKLQLPNNENVADAKKFLLDFGERGAGERGLAPYLGSESEEENRLELDLRLLKQAEHVYSAVREHSV